MFDNEGGVEIQESLLRKSDAEDGSDQSDHGDQIGESYLSRKRITRLIMKTSSFSYFLFCLTMYRQSKV